MKNFLLITTLFLTIWAQAEDEETKVEFPLMNVQISDRDPRPPIPPAYEYVCRFVCRLIAYEVKLGTPLFHSPDKECPISFELKLTSNAKSPNLYDIEFESNDVQYSRTAVFYEETHFFTQEKNSFECRPQHKNKKPEWKYKAKKKQI